MIVTGRSKIYRVEHSEHGLWYDPDGTFTNFVVEKMVDAKCRDLPMGYDPNMILEGLAWISATDKLEELPNWVSPTDAVQLEAAGFTVNEYEVDEYRIVPGHVVFTRDRVLAVRKLDFEFLKRGD